MYNISLTKNERYKQYMKPVKALENRRKSMDTRTYTKKDLNIDTVVLFNYSDDLWPDKESKSNNYKIKKIEEKQTRSNLSFALPVP